MIAQDFSQLTAAKHWHDPILIIGANPVGLITALGLARYRIPSVVLEEGAGGSLESNQLALLDATTLSILDAWAAGLGQAMISQGVIPSVERIFLRRSQLFSRTLPGQVPGTSYPRQVILHHSALEQALLQALQESGSVQVLWQHRVTSFVNDESGIDVEFETSGGPKFLRAPYLLVTADVSSEEETGEHAANLQTQSNRKNARIERYLSVDVLADLQHAGERWVWFDAPFNRGGISQVFALPGGLVRLLYQLALSEDLNAIQHADKLEKRVAATLRGLPYEVIAVSSYTRKRGVIEHFRDGRALFLGSAAHHLALRGASEINSGALDAWNLVWKLALIRAGLALEDLIDSYHIERHKAIIDYMKYAEEVNAHIAPLAGFAAWKRDMTLRFSRSFPIDEASGISGSIAQASSPIFSDDARLYLGGRFSQASAEERAVLKRFRQGPKVGMLAPSLALPDAASGTVVPLLGRLASAFLALCFTTDIEEAFHMLRDLPLELSGIPVIFTLVTPSMPTALPGDDVTILVDADGSVARAYNAWERTLYLVRPDGIIAARRFDSDLYEIPALLRHAVGEDVVDSQTHIPRPERREDRI